MAEITFHVQVTEESDGSYWAEVQELPGCFASGFSLDELKEATFEAIQLWLPDGIVLGKPRWSKLSVCQSLMMRLARGKYARQDQSGERASEDLGRGDRVLDRKTSPLPCHDGARPEDRLE